MNNISNYILEKLHISKNLKTGKSGICDMLVKDVNELMIKKVIKSKDITVFEVTPHEEDRYVKIWFRPSPSITYLTDLKSYLNKNLTELGYDVSVTLTGANSMDVNYD